jgi:hypothetical protein
MSSYTLLGKSPLLATSLANRPFDESLKPILNLVPTKMKFFPIHYFSTDDLITVRRKVSLFDPVLPEIVPKKLSQRFQHLDALECHSRPSHTTCVAIHHVLPAGSWVQKRASWSGLF